MFAQLKNLLEALHLTRQSGVSDPRFDATAELHATEHALLEDHERRLQLIEQNMGITQPSDNLGGVKPDEGLTSVAGLVVPPSALEQSQAEADPPAGAPTAPGEEAA